MCGKEKALMCILTLFFTPTETGMGSVISHRNSNVMDKRLSKNTVLFILDL